MDRKEHWENVYTTKSPEQVSWTQAVPATALGLIHDLVPDKTMPVIDIGGGDSRFVDHLLEAGYSDVSVLDISAHALERAKVRLGTEAANVRWITSDINTFVPDRTYGLWHDRATFHFLTQQEEIDRYISMVDKCVSGYMILATFSENGPEKCSNLPVKRYSGKQLEELFNPGFIQLQHQTEMHHTPFGTTQEFLFSSYEKNKSLITHEAHNR